MEESQEALYVLEGGRVYKLIGSLITLLEGTYSYITLDVYVKSIKTGLQFVYFGLFSDLWAVQLHVDFSEEDIVSVCEWCAFLPVCLCWVYVCVHVC